MFHAAQAPGQSVGTGNWLGSALLSRVNLDKNNSMDTMFHMYVCFRYDFIQRNMRAL